MLLGRPVSDELGFSLNPFHYVKKAAVGLYHVDKAVLRNKLVQQSAVTAANAYAPGSGIAVQAGLNVVAPSGGGGGTVATPAASSAPAAQQAAPDDTDTAPAQHGGGDQMFGMPKKYVLIGGGILGAVVLLSLLRR